MRTYLLERSTLKKGEILAFFLFMVGLNCPWVFPGFLIVAFAIAFWLWVLTATK